MPHPGSLEAVKIDEASRRRLNKQWERFETKINSQM